MDKDYSELSSKVESQPSQAYDLQVEIFELSYLKEDLEASLSLNKSILKKMIPSKNNTSEKANENENLFNQLKICQEERNNSQVKALLSEQIAEEAHRREFETVSEFEEKIQELKYFTNRKELFTQELRKKMVNLEEEIEQEKIFKKAHVIPPTPEALQKHNQLCDTKEKIHHLTKKIQQTSELKDTIVEKSDFLQIENEKIKTLLKNPIHRNQLKNRQQIKKFVKPQLRLLEQSFDQFYRAKSNSESESDQGSSLEEIQFPIKFQKNSAEILKQKKKIPSLNLSNVKPELKMDVNAMAQRIMVREEQAPKKVKNVHLTPSEQRVEMLLERLKNRYHDYQEVGTNLDFEIQNLHKQIKYYQKQNNQLAQALQNQNRKKGLQENKEVIKKKVKAKLKRQNSNPLDYIDICNQDQQTQRDQNLIPIFNLNFARSARPLQSYRFIIILIQRF